MENIIPIKIHNDGKEKYTSWEAYSELCMDNAYGRNLEEVLDSYKENIKLKIKLLQEQLDNPRIIMVDFCGAEIKNK